MPAKRPASRSGPSEPDPKRVEVDEQEQNDDADDNAALDADPSQSPSDSGNEDPENEFEPFEYVCLFQPPWLKDGSDSEEEDSEDEDEENEIHKKLASEHPNHKYIITWEGFKKYHDYCRWASYCDPDAFDMYIYNDFEAWGIVQLIENSLHDFDKELKAKNTKQAWSALAALAHFLNHPVTDPWMNADDADRVDALCGVLSCAILSALNALEQEDMLKKDSEIKDLGLVMALFLRHAGSAAEIGDLDSSCIEPIVRYAKKAGVHLLEAGVPGVGEHVGDQEEMDGEAKTNRWGWTKKYNDYVKKHRPQPKGKFTFNILTFSRAERAGYAFDKVDPLAQFSEKDLKAGNIMLK